MERGQHLLPPCPRQTQRKGRSHVAFGEPFSTWAQHPRLPALTAPVQLCHAEPELPGRTNQQNTAELMVCDRRGVPAGFVPLCLWATAPGCEAPGRGTKLPPRRWVLQPLSSLWMMQLCQHLDCKFLKDPETESPAGLVPNSWPLG